MTGPTNQSGRWPVRVEPPQPQAAGQAAMALRTGPESMASSHPVATGSPERRRRTSGRRLKYLVASLSERDTAVLTSVAAFGFLTTNQIETLHFHDHATREAAARICRRVLARLREARVLEPLDRRIGGIRAGSSSFIWRVGATGDRLLRQHDAEASRARRKEPSLRFLDHRLAVAASYGDLVVADRQSRFELLSATAEPGSWRPFVGLHGAREILKPDLYAVTASGEYEDHWFIEIDRGTESLPTVLKQCSQYERYRRSGREQLDGGLFPRVLWLVPDADRTERLTRAIRQARDLDADLFRVHLPGELIDVIAGGAS